MAEIDPRVISAVDHVQKAALELIAAMRNALDVAEDLVVDPAHAQALMQGVVVVAKMAADTVTSTVASATAPSPAPPQQPERVERIRLDD